MSTNIAFLGLGTMGTGMARRLLAGPGLKVVVWNRDPAKAAPLVAEGAKVARTPAEAAAGAQVVIAMLADDPASRTVWLGPDGALAAAPAGATLIDCSTLSIEWARELAAAADKRGLSFLDAPVAGSKPQAANGELVVMAGGDAEALDRVRPVLALISKQVIHLGPSGSGAAMKLINNFLGGVQSAALAEADAFIRRAGLDRAQATAILLNGAPGSPMVKTLATRHAANDAGVYFLLRLMAKDLAYAVREGERLGIDMPTAAAARGVFDAAAKAGFGEKDISAILQYGESQAG